MGDVEEFVGKMISHAEEFVVEGRVGEQILITDGFGDESAGVRNVKDGCCGLIGHGWLSILTMSFIVVEKLIGFHDQTALPGFPDKAA